MRKIIIIGSLLISFFSNSILADSASNLKIRLNKVKSFHASVIQRITDNSGHVLQESYGDLWVKLPNLFHWHMTYPDEILLISDGENLWIYNPIIEQATITCLKNVDNNTLARLIVYNQDNDWQYYNIKQDGDQFQLRPKINNPNLKQLNINVTRNGIINEFDTIAQDGQRNSYQFQLQKNTIADISKFIFFPPKGVTIDDQRNKYEK